MMSDLLSVSVVIPMYNAEKTILQTLESVIKQTVQPLEIVIVDDGSTDGSYQLVQSYIANYKGPIRFVLHQQPNAGVSKARNEGMKRAQGDLIALLDADDRWQAEKLARQLEVLQGHPDIDFLGSNRNGEHWQRWLFKKFEHLTPISARLLLYKTFFVTPTVIFKRSVLVQTGYFDESQRYAEEGNYWIRVCHDHHCVLLNESLVITGDGKPNFGFSGLSSNLKEMEKGELKNMRLGYKLGVVGLFEYLFLVIYSLIKYIRRIVIVKLRR
ncbi:glycosyltransferase family 2 protein [Olivibacter jilunii]|uniref:glycosyltransferase family 2 protein n=1 Tax=Olivibacter jilunii TaxID=985016 RepID=UPI003F5CC969